MRIYFDACALARLTDDLSQPRVLSECRAVEALLDQVYEKKLTWVGSPFLLQELSQNPNNFKRKAMLDLLSYASEMWHPTMEIKERARSLLQAGYGSVDAAHLATAEDAAVDFLLSTDDRFIKKAQRDTGQPLTRVINPVEWEREVRHGYS